jgi:hypothetical protein
LAATGRCVTQGPLSQRGAFPPRWPKLCYSLRHSSCPAPVPRPAAKSRVRGEDHGQSGLGSPSPQSRVV